MAMLFVVVGVWSGVAQEKKGPVSFKKDVFPLVSRHCLPCHAEDNFNPSELSLDSYEKMMEGGKHGVLAVAGKSKESLVVQKLGAKPPFGERMPLNSKKKIEEGRAKWLTDAELKIFVAWIDQGAKNN
jgi:hypothetical protein